MEGLNYKDEPLVRIGIVERTTEATVELASAYKALTIDRKVLWQGKPETLRLLCLRDNTIPSVPQYRVEIGMYKSYERADAIGEKVRALGYPYRLAHPEHWTVWVGPFSSMLEAAVAWGQLQAIGLRNASVATITAPLLKVAVYDAGGELKYSGNWSVILEAGADTIKIGDSNFRGSLEISPDAYGSLTLINLVKVEDYLRGVVAAEMPASSPMEALKAQAIIARTYLMKNLHRHSIDSFHLCAAPDCQVYRGISGETERTDTAVKVTRGLLLAFNNSLANALFHSTCGGRTADYSENWHGERLPYLTAVNDGSPFDQNDLSTEEDFKKFLPTQSANCSRSKYFRWEIKKTKAELETILSASLPDYTGDPALKPGSLRDIRIVRRNTSGRVGEIEITTETGTYRFSGDEIRWVLGGLRSTMFTIKKEQDTNSETVYNFHGAGWGHGVGLCQIGAITLAEKGYSYKQILAHYYPGTKIYSAWR
ncbi:MAG: SpoIID/LytB domain-containing protein [bacterium]